MYFPSGPSPTRYVRAANPRHRESGPVFAVGHRALIDASAGTKPAVTLLDGLGGVACGTLANGASVEILAWQPSGANGTRYRVRSTPGGVEGWLSSRELRAEDRPIVVRRVVTAPVEPVRGGRVKKPAKKHAAPSRA